MGSDPARPDRDRPAWERVKELLADALDLPPGERHAFLDQACGDDHELRDEVASLLPDESTSIEFLGRSAPDLFAAVTPEPGARIGGYLLRGVIGEGGMGRVYEATQERPHRTVALKVLRPGFMADGAERRFRYEVEALGRLSHPAIAQVHDAGVESLDASRSLSWFAMEKVAGRPLLKAADELGLDREERLELFLRVCEGVAHAHQRGVIHRDLKPDNILVDDDARPHILDFGIARAADPLASSVTTAGEIIGTLAYMSPEQVLGDPDRIDARCDVYALGVILYRLLTGQAPLKLDGLTLPQAAMVLSQDDPRPAGTVDRSLRGDLETILATALAREADRRYPTVDALAADVRHALADEPITARNPSTWYQLAKFTRRHRALVASVAVSLLLLVAAVVGTSLGFVRAERARAEAVEKRAEADAARARAEIERDRAAAANNFLKQILASASPDAAGRHVRVVDLLDDATASLAADREFDPAVRAALRLTLGETYRNLGFAGPALDHLKASLDAFLATDGELAETTLAARGALCEVYLSIGDAAAGAHEAMLVEEAVGRRESNPPWLAMRPLELRAEVAGSTGDLQAYEDGCRAVFERWQDFEPEGSDVVETARNNLAVALLGNGRGSEAASLLERGVEVRGAVMGINHPDVLTQRSNLAQALSEMGRYQESLARFEELEPLAIEAWGPTHPKVLSLQSNRATLLQQLGRIDESLAIHRMIVERSVEAFGEEHPETLVARNNLAVVCMVTSSFEAAREQLARILLVLDRQDPVPDPVLRLRAEMNMASALEGLGRLEEARSSLERVVVHLEELVGEDHQQALISRNNLAVLLMRVGAHDEAVATARRNYDLARRAQPDHPTTEFPFRMNLGRTLTAAGQFEAAEFELRAVEEHVERDPDATSEQRARIREVLADLYREWGKTP